MKLSSSSNSGDYVLGMPIDSLLMSSWNGNGSSTGGGGGSSGDFINNTDARHFLIGEDVKLTLGDPDDDIGGLGNRHKSSVSTAMDELDLLLTATTNSSHVTTGGSVNNNLAELKPLPPFTGYTGQLTINGISGVHYHSIASPPSSSRILIEANNNTVETTNQNNVPYYSTDHVVSSSTMDSTIEDSIKPEPIEYSIKCDSIDFGSNSVKSEPSEYNNSCSMKSDSIEYNLPGGVIVDEDFAAIIGSAMADTTVPSNVVVDDDSRDSWLDLDAWIGSACGQSSSPPSSSKSGSGSSLICPETLQDFVGNTQFPILPSPPPSSLQQSLPPNSMIIHHSLKQQQTSHHSTSHLPQQTDINTTFPHMPLLQNRLQNGPPKQEPPPSSDIAYNIVSECPSPSSSTPYLAHSPGCHVVSTTDIGYIQVHSSTRPSPELQVSFPHTTTPSKKSRSRSKAKSMSSIVYSDGNLGKEKTVHRCNICNRGFLNKSNIKVHLRTHTGEKPFRCEICGKAFRQKAHLIKHAQIHKRVGRD